MRTALPYIPEDAPFTSEQRAWLNGLLAEMFLAPKPVSFETGLKVNVYFATQGGTAERLAKKITKTLKAAGHESQLVSLEKTTPQQIAEQSHAVFIASTYGEGEPPDTAKSFRDALFSDGAPAMQRLRYSVFCLGDRNYEAFCQFGIDLDERLTALGGTRSSERVECDVDVDEPFENWQKSVIATFSHPSQSTLPNPSRSVNQAVSKTAQQSVHHRDNPYHAELRERVPLTTDISSKLTIHLSLGLNDALIDYHAGDACGVIAQNDPALVSEILSLLPFSDTEAIDLPRAGRTTVGSALLHHLQPTRLTRKVVQAFAEKTQCKKLLALLPSEQATDLDEYIHDRGLIDLLLEYPGAISTSDELVAMLPGLSPRLYSISSSPVAHGRELHCTVAVVRYRSHNRERGGVASTMLAERIAVGERVPIYIQPNKRFRLPADGATPIIMIGPGTGIAPFRAFLHERLALGNRGKNWLFFGERSAKTDFLYRDELQRMSSCGHLTRLDTAFSRDQTHKIYVQDRMVEAGAELWRWLQEGAQLYVCGDAKRMAKDVDAALHTVVEAHGCMTTEAAREYVSGLQDDHRYHRDVY